MATTDTHNRFLRVVERAMAQPVTGPGEPVRSDLPIWADKGQTSRKDS